MSPVSSRQSLSCASLASPKQNDYLANTPNAEEAKMPSSSDSNSSYAESESSTIVYGHESFNQFQLKVLAFARSSIWPHSGGTDNITVERLRGGGFNRIIGLTMTSNPSKDRDLTENQPKEGRSSEAVIEYILRIPRFDASQVDADVAALLFVKRLSEIEHGSGIPAIPAPEVIAFDETENNALESSFMVQKRLHGQSLIDVYPQLGHSQQRRVAQELGRAFRRMLAVSSTQAGRLVLPGDNKTLDAEPHVTSWDPCSSIYTQSVPKPTTSTPYRAGPACESVLELLRRIFEDQKAEIRERRPKDSFRPARIDQFCNMASEMDAAGYFVKLDGHFALSHLDLEPRNILVDQDSPSECPIISGILDWDSAVLAPAFMSCTPPMWIWSWKEDEDEDERMANEEPATSEEKELKILFETEAGPDYIQYSYPAAYRLARRLVRFAIHGIRSSEDEQEAKAMLEEWQGIRQQDIVKVITANDMSKQEPDGGCSTVEGTATARAQGDGEDEQNSKSSHSPEKDQLTSLPAGGQGSLEESS